MKYKVYKEKWEDLEFTLSNFFTGSIICVCLSSNELYHHAKSDNCDGLSKFKYI